jgi:hypothetical protein
MKKDINPEGSWPKETYRFDGKIEAKIIQFLGQSGKPQSTKDIASHLKQPEDITERYCERLGEKGGIKYKFLGGGRWAWVLITHERN